MRRLFRSVLLGFACLFLAGIVAQVYFAGLMLFGQPAGRELHQGTGYMLGTAGLVFLVLPVLARAGRTHIILGAVLAVSAFFQPTLTLARDDSPALAALHPVNALLIFTLTIFMVRGAWRLLREERVPAPVV